MSIDRPKRTVPIRDFMGVASNRDPHEAPFVPVDAKNLVFHEPGMLKVRKGHKPVTISNDGAADTSDIIALFPYHRPGEEWIIIQDDGGDIRVAQDPS